MSLFLTAAVVMAISLGLTALFTAFARRAARARGDREALARISWTGTRRQRRSTLTMALVLGGVALLVVLAGLGAGLAGLMSVLSLALAGQAGVLEAVDRLGRGRRDVGAPPSA